MDNFIDFLFWEKEEIIIGTWTRGGLLTYTKQELTDAYKKGLTFKDLEAAKRDFTL